VGLVVAAAIASVVIFAFNGIAATLFLVAFALVDLAVYYRLPFRAVCYQCLTEYGGLPMNERHRPFDLAIFESLRQRRLEAEALTDEPSKAENP